VLICSMAPSILAAAAAIASVSTRKIVISHPPCGRQPAESAAARRDPRAGQGHRPQPGVSTQAQLLRAQLSAAV
jgi:hypothetical protein